MTTSIDLTIDDVLGLLRQMGAEQRAEIWPELVETFKLMRLSPTVLFPAGPDPEPNPHGHFRSHLDLPLTTPQQAQRMAPVFAAVFDLVRQHQHCGCDPTVMAWRAAYAAALALLDPPVKEDGPFSTMTQGGPLRWAWRCSLPHGDYTAVVERGAPRWTRRDAVKAYKGHMKAKHPEEGTTGDRDSGE